MENIDVFLKFCENYGVPKTGLFQTVDLYECRNMAQVLASVAQLGTEVRPRMDRTRSWAIIWGACALIAISVVMSLVFFCVQFCSMF